MPSLKAFGKPPPFAQKALAYLPDKKETISPHSGYDQIAIFEPSMARVLAATGWNGGSDDAHRKSLF